MAGSDAKESNSQDLDVDALISLQEAAAMLPKVSVHTLRRWAKRNMVTHIELPGGRLWFRPEDIRALMVPVEPSHTTSNGAA